MYCFFGHHRWIFFARAFFLFLKVFIAENWRFSSVRRFRSFFPWTVWIGSRFWIVFFCVIFSVVFGRDFDTCGDFCSVYVQFVWGTFEIGHMFSYSKGRLGDTLASVEGLEGSISLGYWCWMGLATGCQIFWRWRVSWSGGWSGLEAGSVFSRRGSLEHFYYHQNGQCCSAWSDGRLRACDGRNYG